MVKIAGVALVAGLLGYWLFAAAQTPIDVRPPVSPMGTSSTDGVSFAWFYDTTSRHVYVCRSGKGVEGIDCRSSRALP
jgi:hypothetical protein